MASGTAASVKDHTPSKTRPRKQQFILILIQIKPYSEEAITALKCAEKADLNQFVETSEQYYGNKTTSEWSFFAGFISAFAAVCYTRAVFLGFFMPLTGHFLASSSSAIDHVKKCNPGAVRLFTLDVM